MLQYIVNSGNTSYLNQCVITWNGRCCHLNGDIPVQTCWELVCRTGITTMAGTEEGKGQIEGEVGSQPGSMFPCGVSEWSKLSLLFGQRPLALHFLCQLFDRPATPAILVPWVSMKIFVKTSMSEVKKAAKIKLIKILFWTLGSS